MASQLEIVIKAKDEASKVMEDFGQKTASSFSLADKAMAGLATGALLAAGALARSLVSLLDYAEGLEKANLATGVSVEFWQKLIKTGDEMGISFDATRGAIERMERNLEGSGTALRKFGIDVGAFSGLNADEKFRAMAVQIMAIQDPTERAAAAMAVFGRSGAEMIPLFAAVASGAADMQRVLGTDTVDALNRVDRAIDGAKTSWKGLQQEVVAFIAMKLPLEDFFTIMSLGFQNLSKGPKILAAQWVGAMEAITHGNLSVGMAAMEMYLATGKQTEQLPKLSANTLKVTEALRQANIAMAALVKSQGEQEKASAKATKALQAYEKGLLAAEEAARKAAMGGEQELIKAWEDVDKAAADHTRRMMAEEERQIKAANDAADEIIAANKRIADEEERESARISREESKRLDEARRRNQEYVQALGGIADAMADLGSAAGGAFGTILTLGAGALQVFANLNDAALQAASATQKLGMAVQGAASAYKSASVLGGAAQGAMAGAAFGPWGAAIGAVGGAILGFLGKGKKLRDEMKKINDSFLDSMGGMEALKKKAIEAGVSLDAMMKAKNKDQLLAAIDQIQGKFDDWNQAHEDLQAAIDKYGFTIEELGPKFAQQKMDEQAGQLLKEFQLLSAAGVDVNAIIARMGPTLTEFVNTSIAAGTSVPEAMRPMVDQLIASGQLLDANGNAFASAEEAGITFAQTLTESMQSVIEEIRNLVAALTGIPNVTRTVTTRHEDAYGPPANEDAYPPMARGGVVLPFIPRAANGIVTARPGGSPVIVGEGGQAELVAPVAALADRIGRAAAAAAGGSQVVQVVLDGQVLATAMVRRNKAGGMPIAAGSVRGS